MPSPRKRSRRAPRRNRPYGVVATPIEERYAPDTVVIHGKFHSKHWNYSDHIVPPISASAAYRLESTRRGAAGFQKLANPDLMRSRTAPIFVYDRMTEPTRGLLEENLALAEGGESAFCFATGMAAVSGALGVLVRKGDRIVAHRTLYGCTYSLMTNWYPRFGINVDFVDVNDTAALERAIAPDDVMAVYFESPCNPTLDLVDIRRLTATVARANARRAARVRRKHRRIYTLIDNTFASPFCQRPLPMGVDIVIHSLTKNLMGFGTDMGGVVIAPQVLAPDLAMWRKDLGSPLAPRSCWPILAYGLPSLHVRMRRQQEIAMEVARFLESHPRVARVVYPGLRSHPQHALARRQMRDPEGRFAPGTLVYFVVKGDPVQARSRGARIMDHIAKRSLAITLAVSLGQVRTLIEHPSSMTHAGIPPREQVRAGLDPGGIRIALGLEDPRDLIADLREALDRA